MDSEGNGVETTSRRRVLVIGGKPKNVPTWAKRAFDIDLIESDYQGGNRTLSPDPADAIVVVVNWVSHNFSGQAHDLGRRWGVPVLKARDGWASAVKGAATCKLDWFVDAVQLAGRSLAHKNRPRAEEAVEAVDNAWKDLAVVEREKAEHLEKRVGKLREKVETLEQSLKRVRSGAQERVIAEIGRRANEVRKRRSEDLEPLMNEIRLMREHSTALTERLVRLESWVRDTVGS